MWCNHAGLPELCSWAVPLLGISGCFSMTIPECGHWLSPSTCSPGPGKEQTGILLPAAEQTGTPLCFAVPPPATLGKTWMPPGIPESLGRDLTVHRLFHAVTASVQDSQKILDSPVCSALLHPNHRLVVCPLTWERVFSPFPLWDRWGQEWNKRAGHNPHPQVPRLSIWSVQMNSLLATTLGQ